MKKARGDSFLKTLPAGRRDQVWGWLQANTQERTRGLIREQMADAVAEWEKANGRTLAMSGAAFTDFVEWYPLTMALKDAATLADQLKAALKENPEINLDDDQLAKAGQMLFEGIAISSRDSKLFVALKRLRQDAAALGIEEKKLRQKVREYEEKAARAREQLEKVRATGGLSAETLAEVEEAIKLL